jgi:hypothetical protein
VPDDFHVSPEVSRVKSVLVGQATLRVF